MTKKKAAHWGKEFPNHIRDREGHLIGVPIIYHFDEDGNFDAYVQPNLNHLDLWEVWIGRPAHLIDDKIASKEEAMALVEQILGG